MISEIELARVTMLHASKLQFTDGHETRRLPCRWDNDAHEHSERSFIVHDTT